MNKIEKIALWVGVLVAVVIALIAVGGKGSESAGAVNNPNRFPNGYWDTGGGYYVDGVSVIDGTSGISAATTTVAMFDQNLKTFSTTTSTSTPNQTLTTGAWQNYGYFVVTPAVKGVSLTFPASSTITTAIPNSGDHLRKIFYNATTTVDADFKIVAGPGFTFFTSSTTPATVASSTKGSFLSVECIRNADTDIYCSISQSK